MPRGRDFNDVLREDGPEAVLKALTVEPFVDLRPLAGDELRRAGLAALNEQLDALRAATGLSLEERQQALQDAGTAIGGIIAADAVVEAFAKASLEDAATVARLIRDLGERDTKKLVAAAITLGKKTPRTFLGPAPAPPVVCNEEPFSQTGSSASGGRGDKNNRLKEGDDERNRRLAFFQLTDLGNAERFRERFQDQLRFYSALETWLYWTGKRWCADGSAEAVKRAEHHTVRAIQEEADAVRASGRRDKDGAGPDALDYMVEIKKDGTEILYSDKIARWGRTSEALNKLTAISKLAAAYMGVSTEDLDADKMKINVNNGTLVVSQKPEGDYIEFKRHDPADLITKISPVDFDPHAQCPEYDKFLARVQPSEPMRIFIHQWLGLSLTGDISEQKLAFLYGIGANGKSVLMDSASYIAGDYGQTVPIETFLDSGRARTAGQASPDLAILPGVRMLRTSEPERNSKLADAMIKLVTGGEPIQARHLNKGFFKFYPQFKLSISGNYKPKTSGTDEAIWRRIQLVPFGVSIPKGERDRKLSEKLIAEASGILNRLLDGLRLWCDKGLIEPHEVTEATADYRSMSDPLSRFLSTCVEASQGDRVQSSVLYAVFEAWCKAAGESVWKQKGFSLAMDERGFKRKHSDVTWFVDIKLVRSVHDFASAAASSTGGEAEAVDAVEF